MFNKSMKIGEGQKYDTSKVSSDGITKEELAQIEKKNKKLIDIYKAFGANDDMSKIDLAKAMDGFTSMDTDGNGKLSKKELEKAAAEFNAKHGTDIDGKDLKAFMKSVRKATKNDAKEATKAVVAEDKAAKDLKEMNAKPDGAKIPEFKPQQLEDIKLEMPAKPPEPAEKPVAPKPKPNVPEKPDYIPAPRPVDEDPLGNLPRMPWNGGEEPPKWEPPGLPKGREQEPYNPGEPLNRLDKKEPPKLPAPPWQGGEDLPSYTPPDVPRTPEPYNPAPPMQRPGDSNAKVPKQPWNGGEEPPKYNPPGLPKGPKQEPYNPGEPLNRLDDKELPKNLKAPWQ